MSVSLREPRSRARGQSRRCNAMRNGDQLLGKEMPAISKLLLTFGVAPWLTFNQPGGERPRDLGAGPAVA